MYETKGFHFILEETWVQFEISLPAENTVLYLYRLDELMKILKYEHQWQKFKNDYRGIPKPSFLSKSIN